MEAMSKNILVIQGHPDASHPHLCHALAQAYENGARQAGHAVETLELAQLDFPLLASQHDWQHGAVPPTLAPAQRAILRADHLVLVYPLWLGDMPALLKGFLEQVARPGFAIDPAARNPLHPGLLTGRSARVAITMGMPATVYRLYFRAHSLKCLKRNILGYVGIAPVRASLIGGAGDIAALRVERWLGRMRRLGAVAG
jgi:putative NADPH-quinone reductase